MPGSVAQPGHDRDYLLSSWSGFPVTIGTINRFVTARLEGDFGGFTALRAGSGEHLAFGAKAAAAASITLGLPCLPAFGTALRLISVAFGLEKFLVFNAEGESCTTIGTREGLFLKSHWMTSSLKY
jgi:hypothetical protein